MNTFPLDSLPSVSSDQMREIDRIAIENIDLPAQIMIENAGRSISVVARHLLEKSVLKKNIVVLAGKGKNSAGAMSAARHLLNAGAHIQVILAEGADHLKHDPHTQYDILTNCSASLFNAMDVNDSKASDLLNQASLIIDGLIGYNLVGDPRGQIARLINLANGVDTPVLANDLPTGLNPDTGEPSNPTIEAVATITASLPKIGLLQEQARNYVGELFLSDISIPNNVYRSQNINIPVIFESASVVKLV